MAKKTRVSQFGRVSRVWTRTSLASSGCIQFALVSRSTQWPLPIILKIIAGRILKCFHYGFWTYACSTEGLVALFNGAITWSGSDDCPWDDPEDDHHYLDDYDIHDCYNFHHWYNDYHYQGDDDSRFLA